MRYWANEATSEALRVIQSLSRGCLTKLILADAVSKHDEVYSTGPSGMSPGTYDPMPR